MRAEITIILLTIIFNLFSQTAQSQENTAVPTDTIPTYSSLDSTVNVQTLEEVEPDHSPHLAGLYSAVLPGLGQVYNKKYWKVPLVWGGLAAFGYFIKWNNDRYQYYRKNLLYEIEGDANFPNETGLTQDQLRSARDQYRRSRDQLALYGILFYFMNIVDAHVDAHLMEFSVNQDLSVRITPELMPMDYSQGIPAGVSIKLFF